MLLEAIASRCGGTFHPAAFNLDAINEILHLFKL